MRTETATEHAGVRGAIHDGLGERYERLPIEDFIESKLNPRKTFDPVRLEELAASIREKGVIEPLVGRLTKTNRIEIIAGARRYRGGKVAGLSHLPVVIREYTDVQAVEVMTIENDQRDDVPPLEQAAGYKQLLMIDKTYTPAMLAERTGHPVQFIWDRLRLLELVPAAQKHLEGGRIGVEHAEVLAKLKPAEQERAIHPQNGGLFDQLYLAFDDGEKDGPLERLKVKTVRELKAWIARHVRFDVQHAAAASPLEFGPVAERVEQARTEQSKPVVYITFEHQVHPDAQTKEKIYVAGAWCRADGKDKSKTCEHATLGLVATGQQQRGHAFNVCLEREKCRIHFSEEIKQKEKNAQLRQKGQGAKASQNEVKARLKAEAERKENEQAHAFWQKLEPLVLEDVAEQVKKAKAVSAAAAKILRDVDMYDGMEILEKQLGKSWFKGPASAWMVIAACGPQRDSFDDYIKHVAKPLGLNIKRLEAVRDKHQPKPAATSGKKKSKAA